MNTHRDSSRRTSILALLVAFSLGNAAIAAEDQTVAKDKKSKDDDLSEIVVTGSLIPQTRVETSTPLTVISAEDIQARGFANVADALQRASFSTGAVQGPQFAGFTQGANTLSFFGLSPSYVKYLIDGRPMSDYPALYNGTDIITNINGIPTVLVDHIDVLPGAQSSIYGSDAIAGVVNVVIKKKMDAPLVDVRYGGFTEGGGKEWRLGIADSFSAGPIDFTVGGQYENTAPIWGYQRDLTNKFFTQGTSPPTASRDFGIFSQTSATGAYYFSDPANCANVSSLFGGTESLQTRPNRGQYCGTQSAGYYTLNNQTESTQGYLHASDDITDHFQVFADVLVSHEQTRFSSGPSFYYTGYDPNIGTFFDTINHDYVDLQHLFSPEEYGGLNNTMQKDTNNSIRATLGTQGSLGSSAWRYTVDWTYTQNKLTEQIPQLLTAPISALYQNILGPPVATPDPANIYGYTQYAPNYAQFYTPLTPAQIAAASGVLSSYSQTEENYIRGQVTNPSLFTLPGGDAGIALAVDGGDQGWYYHPDPGYFDGESYLYTATAGSGHRSRWAGTGELRLPFVKMLTLTASSRYDQFNVAGSKVDKTTYNLGLEFRPIEKFLLRGRYGTAFKAPTLADEYQGLSGFFQSGLTDYYLCAKGGYTGTNLGNCPYAGNQQVFGQTQGNPALQPINAKVWDVGFVWSPLDRFSLTADLIDWNINNEVQQESTDLLLKTEAECRLGQLSITSPTCVAALAQVVRGGLQDTVQSVLTPKINVSNETLKVITLGFNYKWDLDKSGELQFEASYSDLLSHDFIRYPGDPRDDLLTDPYNSTDYKSKANASVTYSIGDLSATVYGEYYGKTPNYLATLYTTGYGTPGAGTLDAWTLFNVSLRYEITPGLQVHGAVTNLFNAMPPTDNTYPGTSNQPYNIFNYNIYGRGYYLGATYKIGK